MTHGDHTVAKAIEVAREKLVKMGWNHSCFDIGIAAADILKGLSKGLEEKK